MERAMDSAEPYGVDLSTLGLKERQTWDRQETFLAAYADAGSIRKAAPAAQISREAVRVWQRDDILKFKDRLEHAQHSFREMLQDKAIELVKELKPGNSPLLLIALLNAHWPDKYRPNVVPTDDTAKDLLAQLRRGGRRKDQDSEVPVDSNTPGVVSEAEDVVHGLSRSPLDVRSHL
jgi:hypothetical protein